MHRLSVTEFSCLRSIHLDLNKVNILIGPQGSGKSLTVKLAFFFNEILSEFLVYTERGLKLNEYKEHVAKQFCSWFPPEAWGKKRFNISYQVSQFQIRVLRRTKHGQPSTDVSIKFCEWFEELYEQSRILFQNVSRKEELDLDELSDVNEAFDQVARIRAQIKSTTINELGQDYYPYQTFIPAGRAFFTSIGRLVAGIEQAGNLDPATIKFARLFATIRDRRQAGFPFSRRAETPKRFSELKQSFFGGEIRYEHDREFVETPDGRRIPFNSLSSGQQELMPMWEIMDYYGMQDEYNSRKRRRLAKRLFYIEEPEAHLFPLAQGQLLEYLISLNREHAGLVLTTHSPYIMTQLNVFLKAGQIAKRKKGGNTDVSKIVPRRCWLTVDEVTAHAISGGELIDILDQDGLIDGSYLESISDDSEDDFDALLEIEARQ